MASTLGMVATIGYSLAAVFALLAVTYYVMRHVRAVRDELTGRTAQREIAEMRAGRRGRSWLGSASGAASPVPGAARGTFGGATSGSLHVRNVEAATNVVSSPADEGAESGTTLLGTGQAPAADESGTTLLGATAPGTESGTTLLVAAPTVAGDVASDEEGTTLLSGDGEARR